MTQKQYYDVKTPEFRLSFPHLFEPSRFEGQEQASYSALMVFDKAADLKPMKQAVLQVAKEKWPKHDWSKPGLPAGVRSPFCDGNEKVDTWGEEFADAVYIRAKTKKRPPIVDARGIPVDDPEKLYPGCYCRAVVTPYAYDKAGNKGISFQLAAVQILRDGERLGGGNVGAKALAMFEPITQEEEDLSFSATSLDDI